MEWKTHRETVTFLNGKSVSRMKSFFRAVKCFFLSEPFAPQVDLCCPSLRGLARVHERCKWITNKKHFRQGKMISWGNFLQVENGTLFNDNWNCVFSVKKTVKKTISSLFSPRVKKTVKKTISSSFSSLVEKTVKKNPKTVFSSLKTHNSSYHWTKFHSQLVKSLLMKSFFLA